MVNPEAICPGCGVTLEVTIIAKSLDWRCPCGIDSQHVHQIPDHPIPSHDAIEIPARFSASDHMTSVSARPRCSGSGTSIIIPEGVRG